MKRRQAVHANKIQATNADDNCDADSRKREEPKDIKSCSSQYRIIVASYVCRGFSVNDPKKLQL